MNNNNNNNSWASGGRLRLPYYYPLLPLTLRLVDLTHRILPLKTYYYSSVNEWVVSSLHQTHSLTHSLTHLIIKRNKRPEIKENRRFAFKSVNPRLPFHKVARFFLFCFVLFCFSIILTSNDALNTQHTVLHFYFFTFHIVFAPFSFFF